MYKQLSKSEISRMLEISRTSVIKYCKEYEKEKNYGNSIYYPADILDFIKAKQIEGVQKKSQNLISFKQKLINTINEKDKIIEELNKKIKELEAKIEELSKNKKNTTKNKQNDLTESSRIEDSNAGSVMIQLEKHTNKPDIELIRFVKLSLDAGETNCAEIARKCGAKRRTVGKYVEKINAGKYNDYLKQLNLL